MAVDHHITVAVFSLEMSNLQLVNRLISNHCGIANEKIKSGKISDFERRQLEERLENLYNAPIYIDDTASLSVFELRTKARRLVRESNVQCIIIDYLQLMNASELNTGSREQEVSVISRSLKGLAKELNIPIIALSQLNRAVEQREGKRPQLSDLRESGSIEQDADIVCFLHRPEAYGITEDPSTQKSYIGLAEVIVAKHRNGAVGAIWLEFERTYVRFGNPGSSGEAVHDLPSRVNTNDSSAAATSAALPPLPPVDNEEFSLQPRPQRF
jgi:replicative DNA helicase